MEPEKLLDNLYETMPSVPAFIFFARKMNASAGLEDTHEETRTTLNMLMKVISEIDMPLAEKKHLDYVKSLADSESEYTVSSEEKKGDNPFIASKIQEVGSQLEKLNELDKKLTKAIYGIEDKMNEVKKQLDLGNNLADEFSMSQNTGNTDFSALFEDKTTEASAGFQLPDLPDLPPLELIRQTGDCPPPPQLPQSINIT